MTNSGGHDPAALSRAEDSILVLIDVQTRLSAVLDPACREPVIRNAGLLLEAAGMLGVPVIATEQYPRGLGATEARLEERLPDNTRRLEKTCFSCHRLPEIREALVASERRQIVIAGIEANVCVLQTALEVLAAGHEVFIAADAVCSRSLTNLQNALDRASNDGAIITNSESVLFEWLGDASHQRFKAVSALLRQQ